MDLEASQCNQSFTLPTSHQPAKNSNNQNKENNHFHFSILESNAHLLVHKDSTLPSILTLKNKLQSPVKRNLKVKKLKTGRVEENLSNLSL